MEGRRWQRVSALRAVVIVAALFAAGCTTGAGEDDDAARAPTGPSGSAGRFLPPVDLSGRYGGPEPLVAVGEDGAIWVAAQDARGGAPHVWVSNDRGATFRESRPTGVSGGEVDLAVGRGVAFVTQLGPGGNVVSYTRDQGRTWQQSTFAGTNYFERELVEIDERGSVYLLSRFGLRSIAGVQNEDATVARSDDGGVTFVPVGRLWEAQREPGSIIGNLVADGPSLNAAYVCRDSTAICYARSTDRGVTWTQSLVAQRAVDVANVYPIVAVAAGRVHVVWSDASDGRLAVWGATSVDAGATWSPPQRVSEPGETATLPWIATGGGRAWAVYLATDVALVEAGAAAAKDAAWLARAARLDDRLQVVERANVLPEPVHAGVISKPVGRPGQGGPFDRSFGDFYTVAVGADGRAHVAVVRTVGGTATDLYVAER